MFIWLEDFDFALGKRFFEYIYALKPLNKILV